MSWLRFVKCVHSWYVVDTVTVPNGLLGSANFARCVNGVSLQQPQPGFCLYVFPQIRTTFTGLSFYPFIHDSIQQSEKWHPAKWPIFQCANVQYMRLWNVYVARLGWLCVQRSTQFTMIWSEFVSSMSFIMHENKTNTYEIHTCHTQDRWIYLYLSLSLMCVLCVWCFYLPVQDRVYWRE